jgi:hypothetical protein
MIHGTRCRPARQLHPNGGSHGRPMVAYRVYFLDDVNRFTHAERVKADTDEQAVRRARPFMATAVKCEIWQGSRLVKRISAGEWP